MPRLKVCFLLPVWIFLVGCSGAPDSHHPVRLLALKGPSAMGLVHLMDSLDQSHDTTLQIRIFDEPNQVRTIILQNGCELAYVPMNMAAILYNKGVDYRVLAVPVWGSLYLVGSDTSIRTWSDLPGKRIFTMARGMTPDVLFRFLLSANGIDPDRDVELDYSFPTHIDLAHAMMAGRASLAILSEPFSTQIRMSNPEITTLLDLNHEWKLTNSGSFPIPQTALLVKESFARDNSELVGKLMRHIHESTSFSVNNPALASQLIVQYGIMNDTLLAAVSIPFCHLNFLLAQEVRPTIYHYLEVFYNFNPNAVGGKIPDEKFIY